MADPIAIANQFTDFYYATFDAGREGLKPLYRPESMMTWEGQQFLGVDAIMEKLAALNLGNVRHHVSARDVQPSSKVDSAIVVLVTGFLQTDDNPIAFCQTFQLMPDGGSFWVFNDIFRLILG
ncbi:nuclear transport factor 2 [Cylindrobasidium torrendii FP15055 ss-10]|uniref:Nuclear transport factor 2 n=1 Tax=Cylindrobasidium torrendii FP15055 ss-10 TaxID=1314674 RepID=A0A0D7AXW4_9AGAR|nr:nuclear transport factor 2 [Cylindrobasidium torrendii FP15055 ss-10]